MTTVLFWLAIPLGFLGLPIGLLSYVLLPFAAVSLFTEFAAPRGVLFILIGINIFTSLPPIPRVCGLLWHLLNPSDDDSPKQESLLGSQVLSNALSVAYLSGYGWIGTSQSTWLLTAYWFICLTQLWGSLNLILTSWWIKGHDR
jgi:hypothetical protein